MKIDKNIITTIILYIISIIFILILYIIKIFNNEIFLYSLTAITISTMVAIVYKNNKKNKIEHTN